MKDYRIKVWIPENMEETKKVFKGFWAKIDQALEEVADEIIRKIREVKK